MPESEAKPTVIVSRSEPEDACARLQTLGLNAVPGEAGTDYVWFPHSLKFGIERKTVSNLLGSLKDRQLAEQAQRGIRAFDRYFLLIEGEMRSDPRGQLQWHSPRHPEADAGGWVTSGWRFDAVDGMLLDLALLGCIIVRAPMFGYDRKVAAIVANTCAPSHKFIRERQRPELPADAILYGDSYGDAVWALCALPGCGPEMAAALLGFYGSLGGVIQALSDWTNSPVPLGVVPPESVQVNGKKIGAKRAARLHDAVVAAFNAVS